MVRAISKLWTTEDYWAVWLGLGIVVLALASFWAVGTIRGWAVTPGGCRSCPSSGRTSPGTGAATSRSS